MSRPPETWSDDEWMAWFDREVEPTSRWRDTEFLVHEDEWVDGPGLEGHPDFDAISAAIRDHMRVPLLSLVAAPVTRREAFQRLSAEFKRLFHDAWLSVEGEHVEWDDEADDGVTITLPGGAAAHMAVAGDEVDVRLDRPDSDEDTRPEAEVPGHQEDAGPGDAADWGETGGGVNVTLPGGRVARVTGSDGEAEISIDGDVTGAPVEVEELAGTTTGGGTGDASLGGVRARRRGSRAVVLALVGAAAVVAIAAGVVVTRGDDAADTSLAADSDRVDAAPSPTSTSAPTDLASDGDSPPTAGSCAVPAEHDMTIRLADGQDGVLGAEWLSTSLRERGFETPAFAFSNVPDATTELVLVASQLNDRTLAQHRADPAGDPALLHGLPVMLLTGIAPGTTSFERFRDPGAPVAGSPTAPPSPDPRWSAPSPVTIRSEDYGVTVAGAAFTGIDSPGHVLVTVLAMCDPPDGFWAAARLPWMEGRIADASVLVEIGG